MATKEKSYNLTTSQFASAVLSFKNQPLKLIGYEPFQTIYDTDPAMLVLKAGRQIGKSLSLAAILNCKSILRSFFNTLYIAPLSQQTSRFSTGYLDPFMNSPLIRKHYRDTSSKKNVFQKSFNNGSTIFLGYAETEQDADRIRGVNADQLLIDEVQDVSDEALPILYETLSASHYAFKRLTGTAKGENNTLERAWRRSNMLEWVTQCEHCGKYSVPFDLENCLKMCKSHIGPCCVHCAKPIDILKGKWVSFNSQVKDIYGFHLPQIIFHARTNPKKWGEILTKISTYQPTKLANEVFGLAAGAGNRILSMSECIRCCNDRTEFDELWPMDSRGINQCVLGVDWSVTGGVASFTIITVLGSDYQGKLHVIYSERLNGIDILDQVERVKTIFHRYNCQIIASDRGVGVLQCQILQRDLGEDKVFPINYVAAKKALRWDKDGRFFAADRTMCIDSVVMKIKLGKDKFESPGWSLMQTFYKDALAIFEEESRSGRRLYRKDEDKPDDWIHSVVFANIGLMILRGEYSYVDSSERDE